MFTLSEALELSLGNAVLFKFSLGDAVFSLGNAGEVVRFVFGVSEPAGLGTVFVGEGGVC